MGRREYKAAVRMRMDATIPVAVSIPRQLARTQQPGHPQTGHPQTLHFTRKNDTSSLLKDFKGVGYVDDRLFMGTFSAMGAFLADIGEPFRIIDRYYDDSYGRHGLGFNPESFLAERLRSFPTRYQGIRTRSWAPAAVRADSMPYWNPQTACNRYMLSVNDQENKTDKAGTVLKQSSSRAKMPPT